ncbi:MAG: lipopolysaccharide transport periplasmic protein LptA [Cardiobacteriaceae bacterium]|nr:lipopolysaccharide transport periplasmic protein LptA [Cardiobacteriaceae bacterium]
MNRVFAASLFLASAFALAQSGTSALPIDLKADSGEYDAGKGIATYNGNVVITQGQMNLKGDRVVIRLDGGEVVSLEAWGKPATFRYVPENEPPIDGEGEYLKYTVATATVDIDKRARVTQGKNETRANHLSYNLEKEHVKGKGVHMTFTPKKS